MLERDQFEVQPMHYELGPGQESVRGPGEQPVLEPGEQSVLGPEEAFALEPGEQLKPLVVRVALGQRVVLVLALLLPSDPLLKRGTPQPLKKEWEIRFISELKLQVAHGN